MLGPGERTEFLIVPGCTRPMGRILRRDRSGGTETEEVDLLLNGSRGIRRAAHQACCKSFDTNLSGERPIFPL